MSLIVDNIQSENSLSTKTFQVEITEVLSSGTPLSLTDTSTTQQIITGTTSQTIIFPDATTLTLGHFFRIWNKSNKNILIQDYDNVLQVTIKPGGKSLCTLQTNGTAGGDWACENFAGTLKTYFPSNNIVYVDKTGDDVNGDGTLSAPFLTIPVACASITTATLINPFLILVGPGIYTGPIVLPDFCSMRGSSINTTIIDGEMGSFNVIDMGDESEISFLSIQNATTGYAGITTTRQIYYWEAHKISLLNCDIGALVDGTSGNIEAYLEYVDMNDTYTNALKIVSVSGFTATVNTENFYTYPTNTLSGAEILLDGPGTELTTLACGIEGNSLNQGILVTNGASLLSRATVIYDCTVGIEADIYGVNPHLSVGGTSFANCTLNMRIDNSTATGSFNGYSEYLKTIINSSSSFFITGKDPKEITVGDKGADFSSIAAACTNITDSGVDNRYIVSIGPMVAVEPVINVPPYVSIRGSSIQTTIVEPDSNNHHVFNLSIGCEVSFLSIRNAGTGYAGIASVNSGDFSQSHKVSFYDCDIGILVQASSIDTIHYAEYVDMNGTFTHAIHTVSTNGFIANINSENFYTFPSTCSTGQILAEGTEAKVRIELSTMNGTGSDTAIELRNGVSLITSSLNILGSNIGLHIPNIGVASTINIDSNISDDCVSNCILIDHPGTMGSYRGATDFSKVYVNPSVTLLSMSYPDNSSAGIGHVVLQDLYQGDRNDRTLNLSKLVRETSTMGLTEGGEVDVVSGTEISIASGSGFVIDSFYNYIKEVTWSQANITIPTDSERNFYIDNSGTPSISEALPAVNETILLGRCYADDTEIVFLTDAPMIMNQYSDSAEIFFRDILGGIFGSGCVVSQSVSGGRMLDLTAGSYNYGITNITPSQETAFAFTAYYKKASTGWNSQKDQTIVNNTQYDDGSGTLASLTTSYHAKHSIYLVSEGIYQRQFLVYSQAQYPLITDAQSADIPTPPSFLSRSVVLLANIIVQEGVSGIIQIDDARPRIGYKSSNLSVVTKHGDLTDLGNDDHAQYLLVTGTRAMTGPLNMGNQNIINAPLVDGVSVSGHASRHLPNGSDPLATAAPSSIGLSNSIGINNSLSHSDHIHQIDNLTHSSLSPRMTSTASTASGTLTLTNVSNYLQVITGTASGYSVLLPDSTTLTNGWKFQIFNQSSVAITLKYNNVTTLSTLSANASCTVTCRDISTINGVWIFDRVSINEGQVAFGSSTGEITGESGFFWDQTNNRLGIGTDTPESQFHMLGNSAVNFYLQESSSTLTNSALLAFRKSKGTTASKTAVGLGDVLGNVGGYGWDGSNFVLSTYATFLASGAFNGSQAPGYFSIFTTPQLSLVPVERMIISDTGNLLLNKTYAEDNDLDRIQIARTDSVQFPMLECFDDLDFSGLGPGTNPYDVAGITNTGGTAAPETIVTNNDYVGIVILATGTSNNNTGRAAIDYFNSLGKIMIGGKRIIFSTRVKVPTLSAASPAFITYIGLQDASAAGLPTNGVFFTYTHSENSGAWVGNCRASSTTTARNSSTTVVAGTWYILRAEINSAGNSVEFFVNGISIGAVVTTNIPTVALRPVMKIQKTSTSTTSRTLNVDYVHWKMYRNI